MCKFPTSCLYYNIIAEFEKILKNNKIDIYQPINDGRVNSVIDILLDHIPAKGPYADLDTRKIVLYDSYLAYLWAYFYGIFVLYEECVQKRMMDKTFDRQIHLCNQLEIRAFNLQNWAMSLSKEFTIWDLESLPNPKKFYDSIEQEYCEKVNNIFLKSVSFLLLHEYAHLTLNHQISKGDIAWSIAQEKEADNYALNKLIDQNSTEEERKIVGLSLVLLYASNFFLPEDYRGIWQQKKGHPNLHDRLTNSITHLNLQSEESKFYIYLLSSVALQQYFQSQSISFDICDQYTAEDLFFKYLDEIDELQ